jgi:beta-lactamase class A
MWLLALAALLAASDLEAIAAKSGGTVGLAAVHLAPGGRSFALRDTQPFPMQSVFKLPIAIEVLLQIDARKLDINKVITLGAGDARPGVAGTIKVPGRKTVRELLDAMVIQSDNVACDKLLALIGGPAVVDKRMRALGITGMKIHLSEREMAAGKGDNTTTPAAMLSLLGKIARGELGLSPLGAYRIENLLARVTTGPKRIRGGLPPKAIVGHKTGSSRTVSGVTDATNDVGLITLRDKSRIAIAVFVHASRADEATREQAIAQLARAVYDQIVTAKGP